MHRSLRIVLQIAALLFFSLLMLFLVRLWTLSLSASAEAQHLFRALGSIAGGEQLLSETAVDNLRIRTVYGLSGGERVFHMHGNYGPGNLEILIRVDQRGDAVDYRILSLDTWVNGWERGNGFAFSELGPESPVTDRTAFWKSAIDELARFAGEFR